MVEIRINGQNQTDYAVGLQEIKLRMILNRSDRTVAYALSEEIELHGPAYDQAVAIIGNPDTELEVEIRVPNVTNFDMVLTNRGIEDCGCYARVQLEANTEDTARYETLARSILTDGGFWEWMASYGHTARIPYCNEPNFVGYIILVLYLWLKIVIDFFAFIVSIFNDDNSPEDVGNWALGCARYHIAIRIGKAVQYWCEQSDLAWSSSILEGDFSRLYLLDAYGTEGPLRRKTPLKKYEAGRIINYTIPQLLTLLVEPFNADFRIIDGTLYFERKDWFAANAKPLVGEILETPCIGPDLGMMNTYLEGRYKTDFLDEAGHKIRDRYDGITDLNPTESRALKGGRTIEIPFASSRFNMDGKGDGVIVAARKTPFVGSKIEHDLILSRGSAAELRLLDLLNVAGDFQYVKRDPFAGGDWIYQTALRWDDYGSKQGLYSRFHSIDDPRSALRYSADEISFKPANICDAIDLIQAQSLTVYVDTDYGRAVPGEIEYDIASGILTLRNVTIWP